MLRAIVLVEKDGQKETFNIHEDNVNTKTLLRRVKRALAKNPPDNRTVTIQITSGDLMVHNKPWIVPDHYNG
jgi:hypothetical protein